MLVVLLPYSLLITGSWCSKNLFPPRFKFGAASAAYQVEGGWNEGGKGESMWDRLLHTHPELVSDHSNGDVACDSYHHWRRDIEMAAELGLKSFRLSISWPRLLPTGFSNYVNEDGKNYYSNLIDGLLEKGIEPIVTLYHFDLPQSLQDLGGWANPLITDWFADYARVVFSLYADRVQIWLTLNEPISICDCGYNKMAAPYLEDTEVGVYLCNKNILVAHAKAWRIYDEEYKHKYHGKVSMANIITWFEPETPADVALCDLTREYYEGRYGHAIYSKEGGWPTTVENILNENAKREGYSMPRLPPFTQEERELVRGTYDFYALNQYLSRTVRQAKPGEQIGVWPFYGSKELGIVMGGDSRWEPTDGIDWFLINPEGMRRQMHWLNNTYGVKDILITENGFPLMNDGLHDPKRIEYIRDNLEQVLLAIDDGINVLGYTAWTLMDNFEWLGGYSTKYGLYRVNFSHPMRTRTPRESARYYASVIRSRTLDFEELDNW